MEGVGARLGRSSARYGTTTMFTGPVRKWKKRWIHVSPPPNNNNNNQIHTNNHNNRTSSLNNGNNNGSSSSNLLFYKWTPLSQTNNNNSNATTTNGAAAVEKDSIKEDEEPPKRKFKYIPVTIAVLEEQEKEELEDVETVDEETKSTDIDPNADPTSLTDDLDEKPDINDVPMEENEEGNLRQDLNKSFDLTAHEGDSDSKSEEPMNSSGADT